MKKAFRDMVVLWSEVFLLLRNSSPMLSFVVAMLTALEAFLGIGVLYLIKLLVDVLSGQLSGPSGAPNTNIVFLYLVLTGAGILSAVIIQGIATYARTAQGMIVGDYVDRAIHERAIDVDLAFYESPLYFDTLQRARQAGAQRPAQVVSSVLLLLKSSVYLIGILAMISSIEWRLLPAIAVIVTIVLLVRVRFTRIFYLWSRRRAQLERRASHLDWLITSDIHAKELRLGDLGTHLSGLYSGLRKQIRDEQLRIEKRKTWAELFVAGIGALVFAGATAYLVLRALDKELSVGDLVLFVLLFRRAESSGRELVAHISRLYDDRLFLSDLFGFLKVESNIGAPSRPAEIPQNEKLLLQFEGVGFLYPSSTVPTLNGINIQLRQGQVVALVGANGSGKTSLIKLMTRLHDPTAGRITLNGIDIRDFDPIDYRKMFSVVFQDYARYPNTVRENIHFGDVTKPLNSDDIEISAAKSGANEFIDEFPAGYDTQLTRMFDEGREISIGQWQKVALARAFFPSSKFIIMDEPTSALDPNAEFELFNNFRKRIGGRGALVISHRLSTVRMADYTYVLEKGEILEQGTHDDLMALEGTYASLFEKQGRTYRK